MSDEAEGATPNQRLLFAAQSDNLEVLEEVLASDPSTWDINHADGLGNTALHYASQLGSVNVLERILEQEVDVDLKNRLEGNTPLHEACKVEHEEGRNWVVQQLLDAGADPRETNKNGDKPADTVSAATPLGQELRNVLRKGEADAAVDMRDVANDDDDEEDDGPTSDDD